MKLYAVAAFVALFFTQSILANEVSLVSGLYRSEKQKNDGTNAGGSSEIQLGARYGQVLDEPFHWFVEPLITMRSYDAAEGSKAPSDSTSLRLSGGIRWYFPGFSTMAVPFLSGSAGYVSDENASTAANTQSRTSGLFYWGSGGFRFMTSNDFFFDLDIQFFESALFATTKTEPIDDSVAGAPSKKEETRSELYVDTSGEVVTMNFGVGLRF